MRRCPLSVTELLDEVQRAGATLIPLPNGGLKWRAPAPLPERLLERLRAAKQELLRALSQKHGLAATAPEMTKDDWQSYFNERAAMREFCAGMPRTIAEEFAWDDTLCEWHRLHPSIVPTGQCAGCGNPIGRIDALCLHDGNTVHFETLSCIARYGACWRTVARHSMAAMGIEWPSITTSIHQSLR